MKAGLEVHQQLATGKLFCACPADLSEEVRGTVLRRLRATGGENHAVDPAAAFQASRELSYRYEVVPSSCLVELDEEPPKGISPAAVEVTLTMAQLLHARVLDEIEVMRKIVVDGSNTAGFQRTALVAVDGYLEVDGRRISVPTICLEEDAARKTGESAGEVTYRLDRLGIPLVEIATGPEITSGAEARAVAEEIGVLLRTTGRVRRGIGTIREDVNISIEGGARVEIKGVQELRLLQRYAELEERRQRFLLALREKLRAHGASPPASTPVDAAAALPREGKGFLLEAARKGHPVRALLLPGFAGLLKEIDASGERLGRELADYARAAGLRGLIHSDELPNYGLGERDVESLRQRLGASASDAFVLVTAPDVATADRALAGVAERARAALVGVPGETRDPLPDGRTRYSRPLPGRDRMYPETDVPPVRVDPSHLAELAAHLPPRPEVIRDQLVREYKVNPEVARQLQRSGQVELFSALVAAGHPVAIVARLLTQDLAAAEAGLESVPELPHATYSAILSSVAEGTIAKEGTGPVLAALLRGSATVAEAIETAGLARGSLEDLDTLVERVVQANATLVSERGSEAFSPLMGDLMREVRGRRDGQEVAAALRRALAKRTPASSGSAR